MSDLLARAFVSAGHEVRVITQTPGNVEFPFPVIRQPGSPQLIEALKWCDAFLQNNISLRTIWPLAFVRRPLFIIHQTWLASGMITPLKHFATRFAATNFAISHAIAAELPGSAVEIGNPFDDQIFREDSSMERSRDLVFVGRLVSDKGAQLLLETLGKLRQAGLTPSLTIVGDGPDRSHLEELAQRQELGASVSFVGTQRGPDLAEILNGHRVMVVPSLWPEPFGIVALEGIACGCAVIGSNQGGLPEAIGPCGITFPNGDVVALAESIRRLLSNPAEIEVFRRGRSAHLARIHPQKIAAACLQAIEGAK